MMFISCFLDIQTQTLILLLTRTAWNLPQCSGTGVLCIQSVPIKCLRGKFCPTVIWPPMLCYEKVQNIENLVK